MVGLAGVAGTFVETPIGGGALSDASANGAVAGLDLLAGHQSQQRHGVGLLGG